MDKPFRLTVLTVGHRRTVQSLFLVLGRFPSITLVLEVNAEK